MTRPARFFRPTLADLLGVFLVVSVALIGGYRLFGDSDSATHVATGYRILENREVPRVDPFSATRGGEEWFAYEWLADVGFALAHRAAGWAGLVTLSALLIAAAHVLLYRFLVRRGRDALVSFVAVVVAAGVAASHWLARPHLLTVLLLVLWTILLEEIVTGRRHRLWLMALPPLVLLWANLHGGFLAAFAVLGCYGLGALLVARPWRDRGRTPAMDQARGLLGPLAIVSVASAAAVLVNPRGWRLPAHLIAFFGVPRPALASIQDFAPASIRDRAGMALAGFLVICLAALVCGGWAAIERRRSGGAAATGPPPFHPGTLLALGMGAWMALQSIRHVEIVAIFGAVVIADGFSFLLRARRSAGSRSEWEAFRLYEATHGRALVVVAIVVLAMLATTRRLPRAGYDPARFPVGMVDSLRRAEVVPAGPVFAPDLWGGYLILEWPQARVFVDGRWDMYGDAFMERYADIYTARAGWPERLAEAGVSWALLPVDAPLANAMRDHPDWSSWRYDATAEVFRR